MPATPIEPLACLFGTGVAGPPAAVVGRAARALLDLPPVRPSPPAWLAPHQVPAAIRLTAIVERYGGAVLADAPGLGKSYVALAVAVMRGDDFTLVVPAVLVDQWRALCVRLGMAGRMITHEALSRRLAGATDGRGSASAAGNGAFLVVDEAHHFRNPSTRRYRALAALAVGARVLLVTATPVHNALADVIHLLRLFLRDDALSGLGVSSLKRAANGESAPALPAALAHVVVARSRARAPALALPRRARGEVIRASPAVDARIDELVREIQTSKPALLRTVLLTRLASSLPAFRESLSRHEAFLDLARDARNSGRVLSHRSFQRLFPRGEEPDLQLALLPLLLPQGQDAEGDADRDLPGRLRGLCDDPVDPKALSLDALLTNRPARTIVFTSSRATARYLLKFLQSRHRVAAVMGSRGLLPTGPTGVADVLAAFAPLASGSTPPPQALAIDVLVATDLASEGLNLQDARRVIHYDLPWTAARLAQRVGRIDRLGSTHRRIEAISFLPAAPLARALRLEVRLQVKAKAGRRAGASATETTAGPEAGPAPLDWCDRLQALEGERGPGDTAWVRGPSDAVVLVVAVAGMSEAVTVRPDLVTVDPWTACRVLEECARKPAGDPDPGALHAAFARAAPAIRRRLAALAGARWRAPDRDQLSRRLIPMVVAEARRAAREGNGPRVARLDALVQRLGRGMTAGEELALDALCESVIALTPDRLLTWHDALPPVDPREQTPEVRLVAAVVVRAEGAG